MYIVERERTAVAKDILVRYEFKDRTQTCRSRLESISKNCDLSMLESNRKYGIIIERTEQPCRSYGLYEPYTVLGLIPCLINKAKQIVLTEFSEKQKARTITEETILVEL